MSYGAAMSEHPVTALATGEVVGGVLEQVGEAPDLAVVFATVAHAGAFEDVVATVRELLAPGVLIGCVAASVVGGAREVEDRPAVVLWAGNPGPCQAVRLAVERTGAGGTVLGLPELGAPGTLILLGDPFTFPVGAVLDALARDEAGLAVAGGQVAAGTAPGANRLVLDDAIVTSGAVAAFVPRPDPEQPDLELVVSQGCRPIGDPLTVTSATDSVIREIAGRSATDRLRDALATLPPEQLDLARNGVHLGRVVDEHKVEFGRGDFLVRNLLAGDPDSGTITISEPVEVGDTVQFQLRDAESADEDLRALLDGRSAAGALLFTCNGRGMRLFGRPDHDAEVLVETLGTNAVAGMFCAGEIGPIGGRSFLHGFTASTVLFPR